MPEIHKTVFISYRRKPAAFIARAIFEHLRSHDYDVFMDVESIDAGEFKRIIENQIKARAHFLVVLTTGTVGKFDNATDIMRYEIEYAIDHQRNIVPLLINDFEFNKTTLKSLTGKLADLPNRNGARIRHDLFDKYMENLRERFLSKSIDVVINRAPVSDEDTVTRKLADVTAEPVPTQEELSAEEYFDMALALNDDSEQEIAFYTEAIRINPQYVEAFNNRGSSRQANGDLDGALDDYNEAIRLNPHYALAYYNRGILCSHNGDIEGAIANYSEVIRLSPQDAQAYYYRGSEFSRNSNLNSAIADYSEAIRLNPQYAEAYNNRGVDRQATGDLNGAIEDYTHSIELNNPELYLPYLNRGNAYRDSGDLSEATKDYTKAIELNSNYLEAYYSRGQTLFTLGDFRGAIADYDSTLNIDPEYLDAYNNLGILYQKTGSLGQALACFSQVIQLNSLLPMGFGNRGEIYFSLSRFEQAITDFQKSLELEPDYIWGISGLAITYYMLENKDESKQLWNKLIAKDERYRNADWAGQEFNWRPELVEAARKLIATL